MTQILQNATVVISGFPSNTPALPSRTIAWTVSSELLGFVSIFSLFFVGAVLD